jgi:hypothetical protein
MFSQIRIPGLATLCLVFSSAVALQQPEDTASNEQRLYEYNTLREGEPVGSHQVLVTHHDDFTSVKSQSIIKIDLLGLSLYRFRYESEEEWDAHGLRRLLVRVDDDGQRLEISGNRSGERFQSSLNDEEQKVHDMPVVPTSHWNPAILTQNRVLNTMTGGMSRIFIQPHREETIQTEQGVTEVKKHRYSGDLHLDSWYDKSGRWMGMRFEGRDGSTIEYRCRNCQTSRLL